jgi:hypothetical protein
MKMPFLELYEYHLFKPPRHTSRLRIVAFLLRDHVEDALPLPSGKYEVPLILYDRDFATDGQLFYDVSDDPRRLADRFTAPAEPPRLPR